MFTSSTLRERKGCSRSAMDQMRVVEAIDSWVYTRETIKTIFEKHGVIATLHPSPTNQHHGVGAHIHLSISPISDTVENAFLAGILSRLPVSAPFLFRWPSSQRLRLRSRGLECLGNSESRPTYPQNPQGALGTKMFRRHSKHIPRVSSIYWGRTCGDGGRSRVDLERWSFESQSDGSEGEGILRYREAIASDVE